MEINAKDQASLFAKLARVASKIGNLEKTGTNTHFNYKFVEENAVSDTVRRLLSDEGIAFFASMDHVEINTISTPNSKGGETLTIHAVCTFTFTFADGETGATFACRWHGEAKDQQDKAINKAATAALKYYLLKNFMISTGKRKDDPDTDSRLDRSTSGPKPAQPKPDTQQRQTTPTDTPVTFTAESAGAFIDWSLAQFPDLTSEGIYKALRHIVPELELIQQWPMSNQEAIAAIIAYQADYDRATLNQWFKNLKSNKVLKNRAHRMVETLRPIHL